MLFHKKPPATPREYVVLSPIYGLNDHGEDVPLLNRREALRAARYFIALVDDPDATAQVVNRTNRQVYTVRREAAHPNVFTVTWANGGC